MRFIFVLVVCVQIACTGFLNGGEKASNPSFRVLIVFDPSASKLHKIDALKIKKSFENIAWSVKAPIDLKMVERNRFSSKTVQKWSKRIRQTDIAIVYYSGPQAENPGYDGSWPSIALSSKRSTQIIPVIALSDTFLVSRPKLSLVIADCYDKVVKTDMGIRRWVGIPFKKVRHARRVANLRKKWFQAGGSLAFCSHQRGEPGYGIVLDHQYSGGVFTEALLRKLPHGKLSDFSTDLPIYMMKAFMPSAQNIKCAVSIKD